MGAALIAGDFGLGLHDKLVLFVIAVAALE